MGDEGRTKFWHNLRCGDMVLKEPFPVLFGIAYAKDVSVACAKDVSVADNMEFLGDSTQ